MYVTSLSAYHIQSSISLFTIGPSLLQIQTLPQNHIFNPNLPPTPSLPRLPRRNESILSNNGSPLANPVDKSSLKIQQNGKIGENGEEDHEEADDDDVDGDAGDEDDEEGEEDSDLDLPDPELLEAKLLAASQSAKTPITSKSSRKPKRAPSLMFRQSLAAPTNGQGEGKGALASIPLSDGRMISFNPMNLSPGRIDGELEEGGLKEDEKERVKVKVREEVVKSLTGMMERWKVV